MSNEDTLLFVNEEERCRKDWDWQKVVALGCVKPVSLTGSSASGFDDERRSDMLQEAIKRCSTQILEVYGEMLKTLRQKARENLLTLLNPPTHPVE